MALPNKETALANTREKKRQWHVGRLLKTFLGPEKSGVVRMGLEYSVEGQEGEQIH